MQQEIKGDSSFFYKFLLRLKKYIDVDEVRGGGTMYIEFKASRKHETLITII